MLPTRIEPHTCPLGGFRESPERNPFVEEFGQQEPCFFVFNRLISHSGIMAQSP
jgi:hypothetical protein